MPLSLPDHCRGPFLATSLRVVSLFLACALLLPGVSLAGEKLRLQLKWTHAFQFAGFYAADAKGYYRDAGLDVELIEAAPDTDVVARVIGGAAEFGIGTSNLLLDRHAGRPVMALAAIFQHSPQVILARHDDKLQSVHDLKGRRLMLEQQAGELLAYLQREGLRREALQLQPHSFDANSLMSGATDALSAYQTFEPFLLDQRLFPYIQLSPRAAGIDFYGDVLFTSDAQYLRHRDRTRAFVAASLRGWEYATQHPEEMIALIRERFPDRLSAEHLKFEADKSIPLIRNDLVPIGYMHRGRWQHIADTYAEIGMLPPGFNFDAFLPQPEPTTDYGRIALWLAGLTLLAGLAGSAALYVTRLNRKLLRSQQTLADHASDLELQNAVLAQLNAREPFKTVLETLVRGVEARHPGLLCSVLLLDDSGTHLRHGAAPSLPDFYNQAVDGLTIGEGVGSCGTAAFTGQRVVVEDIARHPYWQAYTELTTRAGLGACWSQPILDAAGRVRGTFAIYHRQPATPTADEFALIERYAGLAALILQRARDDAEIDRSHQLFELITENSNDVIWLMDLPDLKFSYISPSVQRLRGWTAEEIMQQPLAAALTPESGERVGRALEQSLVQVADGNRDARIRVMEVDQPHKDGHIVPTEVVTTILLDISGRPQQVLGITRDISERRRTEAELDRYRHHLERMVEERTEALSIAKEAAEAANRAKSTFLATMSHELRTPMNAIMGMTDLALRRATDERQKSQLQKALTGAEHLLAVINDVLDLSRIEAERLQLKSMPFTLGEVLDNLNNLVGHLADARGLNFSIDIPPALAATPLQGDPYRLGQILLNLCGNGIKFTQHGQVTLRIVEGPSPAGQCRLHCEIEDTGIGIAPEAQKRLFRAFEQADGSSTRRHGGTGLGLAISKRLVEMMDGEIGVRSEPGQGSTFWFTITLTRRADPSGANARPPIPSGDGEVRLRREHAGLRILLVEDDALNREVSRDLLLAAGLDVDTAEDGREAVSQVLANDYALVLMDLQMPRLNGLEACAEIRAAGYTELPIIAMTANVFAEDRQRCLEAGMNDHVAKPVDPERLYDTLLQWLARPRRSTP